MRCRTEPPRGLGYSPPVGNIADLYEDENMRTLHLNWGQSKGKATENQPTVNAYEYGRRVASAIGDGDLRGKVLADYIARTYPGRLGGLPETFEDLRTMADRAGIAVVLASASAARDVVIITEREADRIAA